MNFKSRLWLLWGLTFLIYLPALRGGFLWDDDAYLINNSTLRSLQGLWDIWFRVGSLPQYYPLTFTSLWADFRLWGLNPFGYHLVNILLHALNGLLVWRLFDFLKVRGAWVIGLVFALHPVHVESVAWITERKNVLSGFFFLSSLLTYLRFKNEKKGLWPWYFLAYFLFLGAVFSKTVVGTFSIAVLFILWWKEGRFSLKDVLLLIPFFATSVMLGGVTVAVENRHILSTGIDEWSFSWVERLLIAGRAVSFYIEKLFWPHPLVFIYPRWEIDPRAPWQWFFPLSFVILAALLWIFRRRLGRGPLAVLGIYVATLFPVLGFKNFFPMRFSFVADHFQYLASIGPLALAVTGTAAALEKRVRLRQAVGAIALLICVFLSWQRSSVYKNQETLWGDTISKNPGAWMAHNNLAIFLMEQGRDEEAKSHLKEAVRLKPDFAEAWNNLGTLKGKMGKMRKAVRYYAEAIRHQPNSAEFHNNYAAALFTLGKTKQAVAHYLKAAELNPNFADPYYNLGNLFLKQGETEAAIQQYQKALLIHPLYAEAYINLGAAFSRLGKVDEAIAHYQKALEILPAYAEIHNNLANALAQKGRGEEALRHYREAVRLRPNSARFHVNLANLLLGQGKMDEATEHYNEAARLNPESRKH